MEQKIRKVVALCKGNTPSVEGTMGTNNSGATGRWEQHERHAFLRALRTHGKGRWKQIGKMIPNRTTIQVKTHAQMVLRRIDSGEDVFADLDEPHEEPTIASISRPAFKSLSLNFQANKMPVKKSFHSKKMPVKKSLSLKVHSKKMPVKKSLSMKVHSKKKTAKKIKRGISASTIKFPVKKGAFPSTRADLISAVSTGNSESAPVAAYQLDAGKIDSIDFSAAFILSSFRTESLYERLDLLVYLGTLGAMPHHYSVSR